MDFIIAFGFGVPYFVLMVLLVRATIGKPISAVIRGMKRR